MASSTVPAVAWIGPAKPPLTRSGSRPQWSRWAWVSTTASRLCRVEAERDPVADRLVRAALEHAAVDQDPGPLGLEEELRTGDGGRATQEVDLHGGHGDSPHVHRGIVASMPPPNAVTRSGRLDLRAAAPRIPALMVGLVLFGFGIALDGRGGARSRAVGSAEPGHRPADRPGDRHDQHPARHPDPGPVVATRGAPGHRHVAQRAVDRHVDEYRHRPAADTARRRHGRASRDDARPGSG